MTEAKIYTAIGLMSGTSLDGVDAAILETDGVSVSRFGEWLTVPFENHIRDGLRALMRGQGNALNVEKELTQFHARAVQQLLAKAKLKPAKIDVIGFHGQTITHKPQDGITWQLGNGALLAAETGIDVVCDFRRSDVAHGGQGAPLVPLFHAALAHNLPKPVAVLNIGGVANVTFIGQRGNVIAFDTGPGNALLNDLVHSKTGQDCDLNGALARAGRADQRLLTKLMEHPFFAKTPPKSLDRNAFDPSILYGLPVTDGAATLTQFTAACVQKALAHLPEKPHAWYVCGGGRHNPALMEALKYYLGNVELCDILGWQGDALEAQAFGFLAVRSLKGMPLSMPGTTGVSKPVTGGALYKARTV